MKSGPILGVFLSLASLAPIPAFAGWPSQPDVNLPIAAGLADERWPAITGDGAGGAIISWVVLQDQTHPAKILVQRVDRIGKLLWGSGVSLTSAAGQPFYPTIVSDGSGGAIVAWEHGTSGPHPYRAQRIGGGGTLLWGSEGVSVAGSENGLALVMTSDGAGGAILAWSSSGSVRAQRVGEDGTSLWGSGAVSLSSSAYPWALPAITSDGEGGALIAWERMADPTLPEEVDVAAQRLNAAGQLQWGDSGVLLSDAPGPQGFIDLARDDQGGFLALWSDGSGGFNRAQRLSGAGAALWAANGVSTGGENASHKRILPDGAGGAFIGWNAQVVDEGVTYAYVQRLDAEGALQWYSLGVPVSLTQARARVLRDMVLDGSGGFVVGWAEDPLASVKGPEIRAQRFDANGARLWGSAGTLVSTSFGDRELPLVVSDGDGGAILAWSEIRDIENRHDFDVYAQNVNRSGKLGPPARPNDKKVAAARVGGSAGLALEAPHPSPTRDVAHIRFTLTQAGLVEVSVIDVAGHRVRVLHQGALDAGAHEVRFDARDARGTRLPSGLYFIRVKDGRTQATRRIVVL